MIDAANDHEYIWLITRAWIGFRARTMLAWVKRGHWIRAAKIRRYLDTHQVRKLHIGSTYAITGFLNSQILGEVPIDITRRLPFPDCSLDLIYSSHLVEHIHRQQLHGFLADSHRVLRPRGKHLVATPSLRKLFETSYGAELAPKALLFERGRQFHSDDAHTACHQVNLTMRAFGHRFLVDLEYMKWIGSKIGYSSVTLVPNNDLPDPGLSDYVASRKPARWHCETETYCLEK